jgi:hypothetical protein
MFILVTKDEDETPVAAPPQFSIQKLDPSTVLIEAVVPEDEPATFEDVYDVYSKKETKDDDDNDWSKVGDKFFTCQLIKEPFVNSFISLRNISHKSLALLIA